MTTTEHPLYEHYRLCPTARYVGGTSRYLCECPDWRECPGLLALDIANSCDGSGPHSASGPPRVLPTGGGGNLILCRRCYHREIAFRRRRIREDGVDFDLPDWDQLRIYDPGE